MRGEKKFKELFSGTIKQTTSNGKGRNSHLLSERNGLLLYRYYYYARLNKLKYEEIIAKLVIEFHIASATIVRLITFDEVDRLNEIKKENPGAKALERRYPHLNWKV